MKRSIEKYDRIADRPHLIMYETSVCNIPERLDEYDSSFFLVYNLKESKFEVHSLDNQGNSYCFAIPYDEVDARVLSMVERNDLKKKSLNAIIREMDKKNDDLERHNERKRREYIRDAAVDMRSSFKKLAEEVY